MFSLPLFFFSLLLLLSVETGYMYMMTCYRSFKFIYYIYDDMVGVYFNVI